MDVARSLNRRPDFIRQLSSGHLAVQAQRLQDGASPTGIGLRRAYCGASGAGGDSRRLHALQKLAVERISTGSAIAKGN